MRAFVLATCLVACGACYGQDKPKSDTVDAEAWRAAQAKLAEKDKARQAEREKMVTISAGELADLRAKIESLEAEVRSLKGGTTKPTTVVAKKRNPTAPEVGMTRDEVERWVKSTLGAYRIAESKSRGGRGVANGDVMKIERVGKVSVATGTKTNALGQERPTYTTEERAESAYTVTFENGVVTSVAK